jgi:hypothetical protein
MYRPSNGLTGKEEDPSRRYALTLANETCAPRAMPKKGEGALRRWRFKLPEAWREVGLDELKVAETMAVLIMLALAC